ncbi:MAG TPA: effector-associated domain EAD1-containing protein [Caldilineaceae bacterium]|nr:effector-associated domain EAD1-containing protein [Caldilineaceae bacterium]
MDQQALTTLRRILANLYPEESSIRRVATDAEIATARVNFQGSTLNIWHEVLTEAQKSARLDALLDVVHAEYRANTDFQAFYQRHRQPNAPAEPTPPTPSRPVAEPEEKPTSVDSATDRSGQAGMPTAIGSTRQVFPFALVAVVAAIVLSGVIWYRNALPATTPVPTTTTTLPTEIAAAAAHTPTTSPTPVPPSTTSAPSATVVTQTLPSPVTPSTAVSETAPLTTTVIPTLTTTGPPTATAPGLRVLDDGLSAHTYFIEGQGITAYELGDELLVYAEPNPGIEVAIALLEVVGKGPNSLTAQALLVHPQYPIRARMRVDGNLAFLSKSQLVPVFDYADGYVLGEGRVRLRPDHQLAVGTALQALSFARVDGEIIDALPTDTVLTITGMGVDGAIAAVALVSGTWPVTGTVVAAVE